MRCGQDCSPLVTRVLFGRDLRPFALSLSKGSPIGLRYTLDSEQLADAMVYLQAMYSEQRPADSILAPAGMVKPGGTAGIGRHGCPPPPTSDGTDPG